MNAEQKQEDAIELEKMQPEFPTPRFGDIVVRASTKDRRIWLNNERGCLGAFNKDGICVGTSFLSYVPTGENIFESDLLKLDV